LLFRWLPSTIPHGLFGLDVLDESLGCGPLLVLHFFDHVLVANHSIPEIVVHKKHENEGDEKHRSSYERKPHMKAIHACQHFAYELVIGIYVARLGQPGALGGEIWLAASVAR